MMLLVKIGISIMCVCILFMIAALFMSYADRPRWGDLADRIMRVAPLVAIVIAGIFVAYLLVGLWTGAVVIEGSFL